MRTNIVKIFLAFALLFLIVVPVQAASATPTNATQSAEPIFQADRQVTFNQGSTGPVFLAGNKIVSTGEIKQDLLAAGATIQVLGPVREDVYLAGSTVIINGDIQGNAVVFASEIHVAPSAHIHGSLIAAGNRASIDGQVDGGVRFAGKHLELSNKVGGNVSVKASELELTDSAVVNGNLDAELKNTGINEKAQILGQKNLRQAQAEKAQPAGQKIVGNFIFGFVWMLVVWFSFLLLFPNILQRGSEIIQAKKGKTFFSGVLWLAGVPFVALVLIMTVIGLPVSVLLLGMYVSVFVFAWVFPALLIGKIILPKQNRWLQMLVTVFVISLVQAIPIVGNVAKVVLTTFGAGAFWRLLWQLRPAAGKSKPS